MKTKRNSVVGILGKSPHQIYGWENIKNGMFTCCSCGECVKITTTLTLRGQRLEHTITYMDPMYCLGVTYDK